MVCLHGEKVQKRALRASSERTKHHTPADSSMFNRGGELDYMPHPFLQLLM